jgi:hypothetical protein
MFEKVSRLKLRFDSPVGSISVEDLWEIPLTSTVGKVNLDDIAKALYRKLKDSGEVSFVSSAKTDETTQLKFDIVKHVIDVRLAENEAASLVRANKEKKQQILALIAQKQNEQLAGTSLEELTALANSL